MINKHYKSSALKVSVNALFAYILTPVSDAT